MSGGELVELGQIVVVNLRLPLLLLRQVSLTPDSNWGGDGSLGCGIGYGYLHRIPVRKPAEKVTPTFVQGSPSGSTEHAALPNSEPMAVITSSPAPLNPPPQLSLQEVGESIAEVPLLVPGSSAPPTPGLEVGVETLSINSSLASVPTALHYPVTNSQYYQPVTAQSITSPLVSTGVASSADVGLPTSQTVSLAGAAPVVNGFPTPVKLPGLLDGNSPVVPSTSFELKPGPSSLPPLSSTSSLAPSLPVNLPAGFPQAPPKISLPTAPPTISLGPPVLSQNEQQ